MGRRSISIATDRRRGGGAAGCAASAILAWKLPQSRLALFERAPRTRDTHDEGYGLDLDDDGVAALTAAGFFNRCPETRCCSLRHSSHLYFELQV